MVTKLKMATVVFTAFLAGARSAGAQAEDFQSANFMLPYCKAGLSGSNSLRAGFCGGEILALLYLGPEMLRPEISFCPPSGVTGKQAVQVVVRDLEAHPEQLHQDFIALALVALHQAWPCG
jgi:Rap1a immunity proteins